MQQIAQDHLGRGLVGESLREVAAGYGLGALQIRDCARELQHAMEAARRQRETLRGLANQRGSAGVEIDHAFNELGRRARIGRPLGASQRQVADALRFARGRRRSRQGRGGEPREIALSRDREP